MRQLIKMIGTDVDVRLGAFTATLFNQIKYDKNDNVIIGAAAKLAKITVRINDGVYVDYAEQCARHFNLLSPEIICKLCEYSWQQYHSYCDYVGEAAASIEAPTDILHYIEPFCMLIENPRNHDIAYIIELHCSWEPEHGLSWIIRNNEVLYVGNGMVHYRLGAWEPFQYYKNDAGNFVFGIPAWEP